MLIFVFQVWIFQERKEKSLLYIDIFSTDLLLKTKLLMKHDFDVKSKPDVFKVFL